MISITLGKKEKQKKRSTGGSVYSIYVVLLAAAVWNLFQSSATVSEFLPSSSFLNEYYAVKFDKGNTSSTISDETKKDTTRIIGFSDVKYKEIALKWYQRLEKLGYVEHLVAAQDRESAEYFQEKGIRYELVYQHTGGADSNNITLEDCARSFYANSRQKLQPYRRFLFGSRWVYVWKQLKQGHHVLLTDVDNYFVRYIPVSQLESSEYDAYHAYAGMIDSFPINIYRKQGFTICGGMSWLRSTPGVIQFVTAVLDQCGCNSDNNCGCRCDDQVLINGMILEGKPYAVTWDKQKQNQTPPPTVGAGASTGSNSAESSSISWEGMSGICNRTGHKVKIWDRHTAYRGAIHSDPCPDASRNWIAMPTGVDRGNVPEVWEEACRKSVTE
mmetsp:Transcript_20788/g.45244  ORF Transcript_20788/g.45244 Transcript_20788/m.45244 type:complete len:386 (-) Transcript_20788:494-1651(-)